MTGRMCNTSVEFSVAIIHATVLAHLRHTSKGTPAHSPCSLYQTPIQVKAPVKQPIQQEFQPACVTLPK